MKYIINNVFTNTLINHKDVFFYIPTIYILNKITKRVDYYKLYFYVLIIFFSSYELYNNPNLISFEYENIIKYNYYGEKCSVYLLAQFIYDLYNDIDTYNNIQYIIHHNIFIFTAIYMIYYKILFVGGLLFTSHEISSIFLICKNFKSLKITNPKLYKTIDYLFIITFLLFRCTTLSITTYKVYNKNNIIFCFLLCDTNLHIYWIYCKLKSMHKHYLIDKYKKNQN